MDDRPLLTSLSNPLIKDVRALKTRKGRAENTSFLVEGLHHVGSALEAGWDVDALLYAPELLTGDYAASLLDGRAPHRTQPPACFRQGDGIAGRKG